MRDTLTSATVLANPHEHMTSSRANSAEVSDFRPEVRHTHPDFRSNTYTTKSEPEDRAQPLTDYQPLIRAHLQENIGKSPRFGLGCTRFVPSLPRIRMVERCARGLGVRFGLDARTGSRRFSFCPLSKRSIRRGENLGNLNTLLWLVQAVRSGFNGCWHGFRLVRFCVLRIVGVLVSKMVCLRASELEWRVWQSTADSSAYRSFSAWARTALNRAAELERALARQREEESA